MGSAQTRVGIEPGERQAEMVARLRIPVRRGGDLWLMSTLFRKRGFFYSAWEMGARWRRIRVTALECPRIGRDFLEEDRRVRKGGFRYE